MDDAMRGELMDVIRRDESKCDDMDVSNDDVSIIIDKEGNTE